MFFFFLFLFFTSFRTIAGQCGHRRPPARTWVTAGTAAVAPAPAPSPAQRTDPVAPTRPHYLGHGNAPLPRSTQAAAAAVATHTPCTMQGPRASSSASKRPRASSFKPRKSPLPPPHRRTQVRRRRPPLHGAQAPPCRSVHPPAVPSRRAITRRARHLITARKYMLHPPPHVAQVSFGS